MPKRTSTSIPRGRRPDEPSPDATRRRRRDPRRGGLSRRSRRRLFILLVGFGLAFALVGVKLVDIQTVNAASYQHYGAYESVRVTHPAALRGSILASNGAELAFSEMREEITADPHLAKDPAAEAADLAPILHQPSGTLEAELRLDRGYVVLATGLSDAAGARVAGLDLVGVNVSPAPVRYHPAAPLAAPVLGATSEVGPTEGIEYQYNKQLEGRAGTLVESVGLNGSSPVPGSVTEDVPAVNGDDILTTINEPLQYQTEQILAKAILSAKGEDGSAVVEDSRTGALLAVASLHVAADGKVTEAPSSAAFLAPYEPGSVAKIVTVSGALARGVISPNETFTVPNTYSAGGSVFHDADGHPTEQLSLTGVLAQSSNIGAIQIGQRLGRSELVHYQRAFGLTAKTDIDFPAESPGSWPSYWSDTTLPTLAFGEANAVTAVQMVSAMNTIANGGMYVPPRLVTAVVKPDGREASVPAPAPHRVVPGWVAHDVTGMLEQVVSAGTGRPASIPSYAVAGKTGTSFYGSITKPIFDSTFAGFAPAQDPQITAMVVVWHTADYGNQASAPAFGQIVRDALIDLKIPPDGPQPPAAGTSLPVVNGQVVAAPSE